MTNLKWKTKNNSTPMEKDNIYFTCHPDDFKNCFDEISNDILDITGVSGVIWYKEDPAAEWEDGDMEITLSQMRLFVIPITTHFLCEDNFARNEEFKFAIKHHKPILPLMQEDDLENLFDSKCGSMQTLNKKALLDDTSAISYEEKLKKFLSAIFLGDELSAKVRDEFDACIFLSYRKKDREMANELMKLIHKNDFCRDIRIWYDEFLILGEEFNQAIKDAMDNSDMFTFAVTPNFLEEGNYVMDPEYKIASKLGKPIVPVEMKPTDINQLREYYKDIPNPISVENEGVLSEELLKKLDSIGLGEINNDPHHLYYIGLAYLEGIDVEVDYERALQLITAAAEADYPKAMNKLSQMYKTGNGVKLDYERYVLWLERSANYWERKVNDSELEEDIHQYCSALIDLGEAFYDMALLDKSEEIYLKLLSIGEDSFAKFNKRDYLELESLCFNSLGQIYEKKEDFSKAKERKLKAVEMGENLYRETDPIADRMALLSSYINMGELCMYQKPLDEARMWCMKALNLQQKLSQESGVLLVPDSLAGIYNNLGKISMEEGKYEEAEDWYEKSLDLREMLARETETAESQFDLACSYNNLGTLYNVEGEGYKSEGWYRKSLKLTKELFGKNETLNVREFLSDIYINLAGVYLSLENFEEAENCYLEALEMKKKLCQMIGTTEARMELASCYINLCGIYMFAEKYDDARTLCMDVMGMAEELSREPGTIEARRNLAGIYNNFGIIYLKEENYDDAETWLSKSLELREKLFRDDMGVKIRMDLANSYKNIGEVLLAKGDSDGAKEWYLKSKILNEELSDEEDLPEASVNLAKIYTALTQINGEDAFESEIKEIITENINNMQESNPNLEPIQMIFDLSLKYMRHGSICLDNNYFSEAEIWWLNAGNIILDLTKIINSFEIRVFLPAVYLNLANCSLGENKSDEAKKFCINGIDQCVELIEEKYDTDVLENWIKICDVLWKIYYDEGNIKDAKERFETGLTLRRYLNETEHTADTLYDLAGATAFLGRFDENHLDFKLLEEAENLLIQFIDTYDKAPQYDDAKNLLQIVQNLMKENDEK